MRKVYAYLRCSSQLQEVQHQQESIERYAKANSLIVSRYFSDIGISAFSKTFNERPQFVELLHLVQKGEVSDIICFEVSRISRDMLEYQELMREFSLNQVRVHDVSSNSIANEGELSNLINAFKGWLNQTASEQTSKRVKSSLELLRKQGLYSGGKILWGFKLDNKRVVVDEELKPKIISFFEDYIRFGRAYVSEKYDIPNRRTVTQRIANPKYKEIVSESIWNRANAVMRDRICISDKPTKALNRTEKLLEGILYHKICGNKLVLYRDRNGRGTTFRCIKCKGNPTITVKKSFSGETLTSNVEQEILEVLDSLDYNSLKERYDNRCNKNKSLIALEIKTLNSTLSSKEKAFRMASAKLERAILEDNDTVVQAVSNMITTVKSEIEEIKEKLEQKNKELENINNQETHQQQLIENIIQARDIYRMADPTKKRAILNLLVSKIEVEDLDKFYIYLNI